MTTFWCCEKGDINVFLQTASPHEMFLYYSGYLYDNLLGRALGKEIYNFAIKGKVYLVQKRSAKYLGYDYFMIKASKQPVISLVPFTEQKLMEMGKV